ncbi:hypothetical protein Taro_032808 [Colocasia esculenta]|uniref:Uncharacterized protein n=1 Tax=Colocasia esculenta TaxID=4460 RepID=A0A843W2Y8_COLES|nr:hypothetical protein [Colocasia esculenta]
MIFRVGQTPLESAGSTDPTRPGLGSAGSDSPSRPDSAILGCDPFKYATRQGYPEPACLNWIGTGGNRLFSGTGCFDLNQN